MKVRACRTLDWYDTEFVDTIIVSKSKTFRRITVRMHAIKHSVGADERRWNALEMLGDRVV